MSKFFTLITMFLLAAVTVTAKTVVFDATVDLGTGGYSASPYTITKDGITVDVSMGLITNDHYRIYKNRTCIITSEIGAINSIVFESTASGDAQYGPGNLISNLDAYSYVDYIGTWTGSSDEIIFTAATSMVKVKKIIVTSGAEFVQLADGVYQDGSKLYITSGVTALGPLQVNPSVVYSFAATPPACLSNTFMGYGATLHMPATSYGAYFVADYWCNFANMFNDAVEPTGITLSDTEANLIVGNTISMSANVLPNNTSVNQVMWASSDTLVAKVLNDGRVTALAAGECDIIATCLDKQAVCHVTVVDPVSVTLDQTEVTIEQTQQVTLTATVSPEGANTQDIVWSTTDASVASVNNGVVTGVGIGECDIIASYFDKQAVCHVTVIAPTIHIILDKHEARLLPNHSLTISPTMNPLSTDLKVTSSDPTVAVARLANGVVQVVGLAEGTTEIVISSVDGLAVSDTCRVTVYTELGDVNCDGYVDISDVTDLIDYLLSGDSNSISQTNADCDKDGSVNIADVTTLIDYLLGCIDLNPPVAETFTVGGVTFTMVAVEGGTFTMGATAEQGSDAYYDEKPAHVVMLSSFSIGETEVTQALWQAVMGSNPSYFIDDLNRPVERVSWYDCQTFITKLNEMTGKTFRLPTEAEWEFAARGGNKSQGYKYSGSNDVNEVAWYWYSIPSQSSDNAGYGIQTVATKKANELGLYDMSGNVWEWCQDWYSDYSSSPSTNPTGPAAGSYRVFRGGGWTSDAWACRVSSRGSHYPSNTNHDLGLRLAL